jgi:hypothetical protein
MLSVTEDYTVSNYGVENNESKRIQKEEVVA